MPDARGQEIWWERVIAGREPKSKAADLDGRGVGGDAVDAGGHDVAQRRRESARGRLAAVAQEGEGLGHAAGRTQQELAAAAGRIADAQREDGLGGRRRGRSFGQQWLECRVEQALDQGIGRVVASRVLTLAPDSRPQPQQAGDRVYVGMQVQEWRVQARQLGPQVARRHVAGQLHDLGGRSGSRALQSRPKASECRIRVRPGTGGHRGQPGADGPGETFIEDMQDQAVDTDVVQAIEVARIAGIVRSVRSARTARTMPVRGARRSLGRIECLMAERKGRVLDRRRDDQAQIQLARCVLHGSHRHIVPPRGMTVSDGRGRERHIIARSLLGLRAIRHGGSGRFRPVCFGRSK